jgi:Zn-dependent alcohol dehydrogenase
MATRKQGISRRGLLKKGAAAAAAGAALASEGGVAFGQAPAVVAARTFRAWISRGAGPGRTTLRDVRLRPIAGRQVVVRTEACNLCYSNVGAVLGIQAAPPAAAVGNPAAVGLAAAGVNDRPLIQGHGGVGVVEAVGPEVRRVQVGDRVCVSGTPQCGSCYHCADAPMSVSFSGATVRAISFRSPTSATVRRSSRTRTSVAWPS